MLPQLLSYVRRHRLLRAGDRVGVAVSGGVDSVALLRLLLEAREQLGIVLAVVHFNHRIRGADADADQQFVADLAAAHGLEFLCASADARAVAREHKLSLEAAARQLRYAFFWELLSEDKLTRVATAHTLDDQAETVLLRFLRGAWTRGLAGIYPQLATGDRQLATSTIVRPLLDTSRAQLRAYLESIQQSWREDATNRDVSYARNRIRHELLPLLRREFNPGVDHVLSGTAEVARAEEEYWVSLVAKRLPKVLIASEAGLSATLDASLLQQEPLALRRRLLRVVAEPLGLTLEFSHLEQLLGLAQAAKQAARKSRTLELPSGFQAILRGRELSLQRRCPTEREGKTYEYPLPVPGEVAIAPLGRLIRSSLLPPGSATSGHGQEHLLDPSRLPAPLRVRSWRPGDRYWPAHAKSARKVKELLQRRHIVQPEKALWPVVVSGEDIVWIPGFAVPARYHCRNTQSAAVALEEVVLGE